MKKCLVIFMVICLCLGTAVGCSSKSENSKGEEPASITKTAKAGAEDYVAVAGDNSFNYGYINTSGEWVIAPQYEQATPFSDGYAAVYNNKVKPN